MVTRLFHLLLAAAFLPSTMEHHFTAPVTIEAIVSIDPQDDNISIEPHQPFRSRKTIRPCRIALAKDDLRAHRRCRLRRARTRTSSTGYISVSVHLVSQGDSSMDSRLLQQKSYLEATVLLAMVEERKGTAGAMIAEW